MVMIACQKTVAHSQPAAGPPGDVVADTGGVFHEPVVGKELRPTELRDLDMAARPPRDVIVLEACTW